MTSEPLDLSARDRGLIRNDIQRGFAMSDEEQPTEAAYGLLVSYSGLYPTMAEEVAFVHGVEIGMLHAAMSHEEEFERTLHDENQEVVRRECNALGYDVEFSPTKPPVEGWIVAHFKRRPRKKHLAVVK